MSQKNHLNLQARIRISLQKAPDKLFAELTASISDAPVKSNIKELLDSISNTIQTESTAQEARKALSRQIGPARQSGKDCSDMISQVASLSDQINNLNTDIKDKILRIETALKNVASTTDEQPRLLPKHLSHTAARATTSDTSLTVSHTNHIDPEKWQSFVAGMAHSTIYHDARWQQIIKNNFNHQLHYITCTNDQQELLGVMPLVHLKSALFGSFTISMPYFNYGGPLALDYSVEHALLSYAAAFSEKINCSHMEVRDTQNRNEWQSVQRKVSMILPLPQSDDILNSALGSKLRAQINRAAKNQLEVKFGGQELLGSFYTVFSRNMRDLGTPVYGRQFFADILDTFKENAFICVVYRNGKPLAAGFLLGYRDKLEIPWASSIRSQNHLGANMFMYRSILKEAIARGFQFFDFGRSTRQASTYKFKKQWGAIEHPLHWHYWTKNDTGVPEINPDNPKYKLVIGAWQLLPVFVTKIIGPYIARNLP